MTVDIPETRATHRILLVASGFGLRAENFGFALFLNIGREQWFLSWFPSMPGRRKARYASHEVF